MGCLSDKSVRVKDHNYMDAYEDVKLKIKYMEKKNVQDNYKAFLINAKSISNFLEIINNSKVLSLLNKEEKLKKKESILRDSLDKYNTDNKKKDINIEIYSDYNSCKSNTNDNNNKIKEFIIVGDKFLNNINLPIKNEKIKVTIDKKNSKIIFPSNQIINYEKIKNKKGLYKFVENNFEIDHASKSSEKDKNKSNEQTQNISKIVIKTNDYPQVTLFQRKNNYSSNNNRKNSGIINEKFIPEIKNIKVNDDNINSSKNVDINKEINVNNDDKKKEDDNQCNKINKNIFDDSNISDGCFISNSEYNLEEVQKNQEYNNDYILSINIKSKKKFN